MSKKNPNQAKLKLLARIYSDPKYTGKHVLVFGKEIYTANTGKQINKIFFREVKRRPDITPLSVYIPKNDTLILVHLQQFLESPIAQSLSPRFGQK